MTTKTDHTQHLTTKTPHLTAPVAVDAMTGTGYSQRSESSSESVFLSPRVVDRRAFNELSTELRYLVEKAASERASLGAGLDQALHAVKSIKESEANQTANLALAAKALKALDERTVKVQKLVDDARDVGRGLDALALKADQLIETKLAGLDARVDAAQAAAAARIEALEERIRAATREIEQRIDAVRRDADGVLGPCLTALHSAADRAETLIGAGKGTLSESVPNSLLDLVRRGENVRSTADSSLKRLEDVQDIAATARQGMSSLLDELQRVMGRVDAQRETLAVEADRVRQACKDAGSTIDERLLEAQQAASSVLDDARRAGELALREVMPRIEAAGAQAAAAAERNAELLTSTHAASTQIEDLLRRAADTSNTTSLSLRLLDKSTSQVRELLTTLEPWRALFANEADAEIPAPIRALMEAVRSELHAELAGISGALRSAADRADRVAVTVKKTTPAVPADAGRSARMTSNFGASHAAD